jgi:thiamine-monophosphate kinase
MAGKASRRGTGAGSERAAIALLSELFAGGSSRGRRIEVGIGDDAAVIAPGRDRLVWTVDVCIENVHFDRRFLSLADVGFRSLNSAASDLAAMGAQPLAALSSLVVPSRIAKRELRELGQGQAEASRQLKCPIVGGNISRGSELGVTTTVLGEVPRPIRRSGARPGDELWLVGDVGLARAGLLILSQGPRMQRTRRAAEAQERCVEAWRRPRALISRGRALRDRAHAGIDISDGLSGDAGHLAEASGVRIVIDKPRLALALSDELSRVAELLGRDALALALEGGEDYALLATGPRAKRPRWVRVIGRVEAGEGAVLEEPGRAARKLRGGFDHLAG